MDKFKVTIKVIDIPYTEWSSYLFDLTNKFDVKIEGRLDTYWGMVDEKAYEEILHIVSIFESRGKTIIVKKGGL
jgi:hypothetical protein